MSLPTKAKVVIIGGGIHGLSTAWKLSETYKNQNDIVVLDEGIVSQKGSPMELYNNPNNLFVGGFIGSPKMNFISTKITSKIMIRQK